MKIRKTKLWLWLACLCLFGACNRSGADEIPAQKIETASVEKLMPERVQTVFNRSCYSCHGYDGHGIVGVAPDLRQTASRSSAEWVEYFSNPKSSHPGSSSPEPIWKSRDEIISVSAYLSREGEQTADPAGSR